MITDGKSCVCGVQDNPHDANFCRSCGAALVIEPISVNVVDVKGEDNIFIEPNSDQANNGTPILVAGYTTSNSFIGDNQTSGLIPVVQNVKKSSTGKILLIALAVLIAIPILSGLLWACTRMAVR